jgi:hypothetical protein
MRTSLAYRASYVTSIYSALAHSSFYIVFHGSNLDFKFCKGSTILISVRISAAFLLSLILIVAGVKYLTHVTVAFSPSSLYFFLKMISIYFYCISYAESSGRMVVMIRWKCETSGSHGGVYEDGYLLGCCAV